MATKKSNLQTQLDTAVKVSAEQVAKKNGFSNLQDAVRWFVVNLANESFKPVLMPVDLQLSGVRVMDQEVQMVLQRMEKGDYTGLKVAKTPEEFLEQLNTDD